MNEKCKMCLFYDIDHWGGESCILEHTYYATNGLCPDYKDENDNENNSTEDNEAETQVL